MIGAWDCTVTQMDMLEFVPRQHLGVWVHVNGEVLRLIRGAEGPELDRMLKWYAILAQILLRSPQRGGKPGRLEVAKRFQAAVEEKWGTLLKFWISDRHKILEKRQRLRDRPPRSRTPEEVKDANKRKVIELIEKNQVSRAMSRINGFGVAAMDTEEDREVVRAKYLERKAHIPLVIERQAPVNSYKGMVERLTKLRKGAAPGTGGLRSEYVVSWSREFSEKQAADLEDFAYKHSSGAFPAWWYTVWGTVQTVGLYKDETQSSIRPLGIRNPLLKAIHRETISESKPHLLEYLEPQQLGMSLGGGIKLVHSIRMTLELHMHDK